MTTPVLAPQVNNGFQNGGTSNFQNMQGEQNLYQMNNAANSQYVPYNNGFQPTNNQMSGNHLQNQSQFIPPPPYNNNNMNSQQMSQQFMNPNNNQSCPTGSINTDQNTGHFNNGLFDLMQQIQQTNVSVLSRLS